MMPCPVNHWGARVRSDLVNASGCTGASFGHGCEHYKDDVYLVSWKVDTYSCIKRKKSVKTVSRVMRENRARIYCKRWQIKFPNRQLSLF